MAFENAFEIIGYILLGAVCLTLGWNLLIGTLRVILTIIYYVLGWVIPALDVTLHYSFVVPGSALLHAVMAPVDMWMREVGLNATLT